MIKTVFVIISMIIAVATVYCLYKIEENTFTDKKVTKYWVGAVISALVGICVIGIWNYVEFGI